MKTPERKECARVMKLKKSKINGIEYITGDNFLDMLDNGVILCQLAKVIRERAQHAVYNGLHKGPVPELNGRCFENAARRSFFSRDNMENFIKFCRHLGVHQNLLFESDDLVLQNQPRNVVLCLLELSRITTKFNMEPPGLVQLEKEIAEEEQRSGVLHDIGHSSLLSWQFRPSASSVHNSLANRKRPVRVSSVKCRRSAKNPQLPRFRRSTSEGSSIEADSGHCQPVGGSDGIPSDHTEDDWSRGSSEDPDSEVDSGQNVRGDHRNEISELDRKVAQATKIAQKHCHCDNEKCSKLAVKKVGDGKYNIAGRNVFVRLLKGRHMMVRVGGGWDTLEHFLLRHDPCQKFISIRQKKTQNLSKRLYYLEYQPKKKYWSRH
ncbi:UNVERIFIED_CONTAM: hypothetical protein PYX00_005750 [Menopon gallinae]|uniref:Growth arrest-specific protein 2 n=1 Tax=Menopon gallinae TaxID=328185 RepID=A0AAW2HUI9_9NEOP